MRKLSIKAGGGAVRIKAKGEGERLGLPALPLEGPLTAQLLDGAGGCYGSTSPSAD
jgi:hypothetical protein